MRYKLSSNVNLLVVATWTNLEYLTHFFVQVYLVPGVVPKCTFHGTATRLLWPVAHVR